MTERINVADLPDFDASLVLDSDEAVAAYLSDILQANDSALLTAALGDIARANFSLTESQENELLSSIAEIERGEYVTLEELRASLAQRG